MIKEKKKRKPIVDYIITSLTMLTISLVFSLLSVIFLVDKIPRWVQAIVSFVFIAPIVFIEFSQGKSRGERLYRDCCKNRLSDIHAGESTKIPMYKCLYHVIGYAAPLILLTIFAVIFKSIVTRLIAMAFIFPVCLFFSSIGALNLQVVSWTTLIIFIPYILLNCAAFIFGYYIKIQQLKRQQRNIESEIRMFNN